MLSVVEKAFQSVTYFAGIETAWSCGTWCLQRAGRGGVLLWRLLHPSVCQTWLVGWVLKISRDGFTLGQTAAWLGLAALVGKRSSQQLSGLDVPPGAKAEGKERDEAERARERERAAGLGECAWLGHVLVTG